MPHGDIINTGWLAVLPPRLRLYAILIRLDRPIGIWLLLLPGWWAILLAAGGVFALNFQDMVLLLLFAAGAIVMRGAGCIVNDLWDYRLDQQVERTKARPLASGQISRRNAAAFMLSLCALGFLILIQMNFVTVLLGCLSLAFIVAYPLMKRITWWPQAFLGLTFNFGALMGWAAVSGTVSVPAILLYAAGFFWTLGYDTIYACQDIEDDIRACIKSTARLLSGHIPLAVGLFFSAMLILLTSGFLIAGASWISLVILGMTGLHFIWQVKKLDPKNPAHALRLFKSNRDAGLLILLAAAFSGLNH